MDKGVRIVALFGARVLFGQERANIETLASLQAEGCEVLCVVRSEDWPELLAIRQLLDNRGLSWVKADYIDYPIKGWLIHILRRNPKAFFSGNRTLVRIVDDFKATHIHAFNPFYVAAFAIAISRSPLPLIYRCGDEPIQHNAFYRAVWRFILRRTSHFVADSRFIKRRLIETGADEKKISVIYAPAPLRSWSQPTQLPTAAMANDVFRFVYVGRISESKGVGILVEGFRILVSQHQDIHLAIAGPISDWREDEWGRDLRSRVQADLEIKDYIHFLGHVENIPELLRLAHVHVMPSRQEAYGLVAVEAKLSGRPSIVFDSGGLAELVRDGVDGIVAREQTPKALAEAMAYYIADPLLAVRDGEAATESIGLLGIARFSQSWREVYQRTSVILLEKN